MSNCRDKELQLACFTPSDGSDSVSINHTVVYDNEGSPIATYFSDREGVVIDETAYLGGGVAIIGACPCIDYLYVEQCWVNDADDEDTKVLIAVFEKGFPMELIGHLEDDGVTVAILTGWTKTDDCKCGC